MPEGPKLTGMTREQFDWYAGLLAQECWLDIAGKGLVIAAGVSGDEICQHRWGIRHLLRMILRHMVEDKLPDDRGPDSIDMLLDALATLQFTALHKDDDPEAEDDFYELVDEFIERINDRFIRQPASAEQQWREKLIAHDLQFAHIALLRAIDYCPASIADLERNIESPKPPHGPYLSDLLAKGLIEFGDDLRWTITSAGRDFLASPSTIPHSRTDEGGDSC